MYGGGPDNGILKIWLKSGQWENFAPNIGAARGGIGSDFRKSIEFPMVFSPEHHKTLYLATQYVTATSMAVCIGATWVTRISPPAT